MFITSSLHHGPAKQMRKLKLRVVKPPPPGHLANERRNYDSDPGLCNSKAMLSAQHMGHFPRD